MEALDPLILARLQFAANVTFHILFPTISIAMGWFLLFFKTRFVATGEQHWMDAYQFWIKIFALTFALGVVSGITMSFQFGTNWPGFMNAVGNVAGPCSGSLLPRQYGSLSWNPRWQEVPFPRAFPHLRPFLLPHIR